MGNTATDFAMHFAFFEVLDSLTSLSLVRLNGILCHVTRIDNDTRVARFLQPNPPNCYSRLEQSTTKQQQKQKILI